MQPILVGRGRLLRRNARHARDDFFHLLGVDLDDGAAGVARVRVGAGAELQAHLGARFIDHVDGAVRQLVIAQVPRRQLRRRFERLVGVAHAMVRLVARPQALEDPDGLGNRRLVDRDLLQASRQRAILFDVLELLVRRRSHDASNTELNQ